MSKEETLKVKVKKDHYTTYVRIPKQWLRELGLLLAQEVVLEKHGNPFAWEIRIKPVQKSTAPTKQRIHNTS